MNKDWADYLYVLASLLLTVATLVIAVYAAAQARAAKRSADNEERTVKLTERADVLLEAVGLEPNPTEHFDGRSRVVLKFRNFGRTRANNVVFDFMLIVPGLPDTPSLVPPQIAIGAGDTQALAFSSFIECLTRDTFAAICDGSVVLEFGGKITYDDVFGESHSAECYGEFNRRTRSFICTKSHSD